jgi:beta-galactosidase
LFITAIISSTWTGTATCATLKSFKPGKDWNDIDGKIIDCHAGNIIYVETTKTYYWFGEHRGSPSGVACYSSKDLYNWKNEGVALNKATAGLSSGIIERPKVAYNARSKKYVMWFHYDNSNYGLAHQGVAVCDSAKGPYQFIRDFKPNGYESRDIGMFTDEDNKTYIGYAANSGGGVNSEVRLVEVDKDSLKVTKNDSITGAHCEGPAVLKWNGTYYLLTSQCKGWTPNPATYYTAKKVVGTYKSMGNPCINDSKKTTFDSQPSSIFKVPGTTNGFIYVGDRWNGGGSTKSQYVFLPIAITTDGKMQLKWYDEWDLSTFTPTDVIKSEKNSLRNVIVANIMNQSGVHVYDLIGRNVNISGTSAEDRKMMNIHKGTADRCASAGVYVSKNAR